MMKKTLSLFWTFFKIGAFTFGGGYAMIALLENEFVENKTPSPILMIILSAALGIILGTV